MSLHDDPIADERLMQRAIDLSEEGRQRREGGPFGAVVVRAGQVVGEGWNQVTSSNDPTAHAEIVAIRDAAQRLESFDLAGCVIYSSCEPCPMCLAACYWARVDHLYYANTRDDAAEIGFDDRLIYDELPLARSERSLPMTRLELPDAIRPFQRWAADDDKTPY